ncbi:MAG: hypothetical protein ACKOAY_01230 [Haliscomenobacter sp.]
MTATNEKEVLRHFLEFPLWTSDPVFQLFSTLEGAVERANPDNRREHFLYVEGTRKDKVVLVAHADSYFDELLSPANKGIIHAVEERNGRFYSKNDHGLGLGADDRAGCAMLWLLRHSGHSLLITDGEERGLTGSSWLMDCHPDIADALNTRHQFMVQLDRQRATDFKTYSVGTDVFRDFIHTQTGYNEPDRDRRSDIVALCRDICGVNFSIGYYEEHTASEYLVIKEWMHSLKVVRKLLENPLPRFPLGVE